MVDKIPEGGTDPATYQPIGIGHKARAREPYEEPLEVLGAKLNELVEVVNKLEQRLDAKEDVSPEDWTAAATVNRFRKLPSNSETAHIQADECLVEFVKRNGFPEVAKAWEETEQRIGFWYS